jgi:tetratricopeptide (TPR) repeat protein
VRNRLFKKDRWAAGAGLVALVVAAALCYRSLNRGGRDGSLDLSRARAVSGLPDLRPADVPLALLGDFYEHLAEHCPPRDPTHPLQLRERFYRPPADPFDAMISLLGGNQPDRTLKEELDTLERQWARGEVPSPTRLRELETLAAGSSLRAEVLLDAGRSLDFLMDDQAAAVFFRAGLTKAKQQYEHTPPGDPSALPLLYQLDQTKALWRLQDNTALAQRFELAARLYPGLSVEARRSQYLYANSLFNLGKSQEAADTILRLWRQHEKAGDLGTIDPSDRAEMDWVSGLYLSSARRYEMAIPYLKRFLQSNDNRKPMAARYLSICLRHLGRSQEAEGLLARYHRSTRPAVSRPPVHPVPAVASPPSPSAADASMNAG